MFGFNKYHYSFIYKIVCLDPNIDDFYIGSTVNLNARCLGHIRVSLNKNQKNYYNKLYTLMRDSGGYENWEMQVIKHCKFETKRELLKEEQKYIDELKPSLNSCNSYQTIEGEQKRKKKYYEDNKENEKEKERKKKWYEDNKKKKDKWYQDNKEKIKEKAKIKIECECGSVIRKDAKIQHKKTQKHQAYLNNLSS